MVNTKSNSALCSRGASGADTSTVAAPERADCQLFMNMRAVEAACQTMTPELEEQLVRKIGAAARSIKREFDFLHDEIRRSANDLEERLNRLETFQMDSGETLPHEVAATQEDLNDAMESRANLSQGMYLRFLRTRKASPSVGRSQTHGGR